MAGSGAEPRVAVIGAGIAGLAAAYFLGKAGISVDVFEVEDEIGGLARSFDLDGLRVERYYHFICLPDIHLIELAKELGIDEKLRWRKTETTFFHQGKLYPFTSSLDLLDFSPIPFWSRTNMGLQTLRWNLIRDWTKLDDIPAKKWLISHLGERTYEVVWAPLLTMKFGRHHDQVSAAWVWHRIHRVFKSRRSPLHPQVMGYFEEGTETLLNSLHQKIEEQNGRIRCGSPVEAILDSDAGRVRGVRVGGEDLEYNSVVATTPLPITASLLHPEWEDYRTKLMRVQYIGVVCLVIQLVESVSQSFWCNIHDDRLPYNGVIETSQLNPGIGGGGPLVYVPNYLPTDHPRFLYTDEQFQDEFIKALPVLMPGADNSTIRSFRVFRSRLAQAVCTTGFRRLIPGHAAPLKGLFITDSTQIYPEDRTLSGMIGLAKTVSGLVRDYVPGHSDH